MHKGFMGRMKQMSYKIKITSFLWSHMDSSAIRRAFLFLWLEAPESHPYPEEPDTILDILFKGLVEP
jgi:hypothetical protein